MRGRHVAESRALGTKRCESWLVLDRLDAVGGLAHLDRQRRGRQRTGTAGQHSRRQHGRQTSMKPFDQRHLALTGMQYCPEALNSEQNSDTSANWPKPPAISRTKVP